MLHTRSIVPVDWFKLPQREQDEVPLSLILGLATGGFCANSLSFDSANRALVNNFSILPSTPATLVFISHLANIRMYLVCTTTLVCLLLSTVIPTILYYSSNIMCFSRYFNLHIIIITTYEFTSMAAMLCNFVVSTVLLIAVACMRHGT